jgi:dUTP pyrophosphatase
VVEQTVAVALCRLDPDLPVPGYAHPGDAGADLYAAQDVDLAPGEGALVPTGVAIALPDGHVGLVHPRSGLAARLGVTVLNAPGTVDAGYRGEILVNLINHDPATVAKISRGDRIAQLVVQRVERAAFTVVDSLDASSRGAGGHGSTGGHAGLNLPPAAAGGTDLEAKQ